MPTIIVEDGSIVEDANSYIDVSYLDTYASDRGYSLPSSSNDKEVLILKAMDCLEGRYFQGVRTSLSQFLSWPRKGVYVDYQWLDEDEIPELLKKAVAQLVVEQHAGTALYPSPRVSSSEGFVIEKTVGPITKRFAAGFGVTSSVNPIKIAAVELYLRPLLGVGNYKETIRI